MLHLLSSSTSAKFSLKMAMMCREISDL
jgi:hypothetical protein